MGTDETSPALRVLVVDDEPNIRQMLSMSLSASGHSVTGVGNPKDALVQVARQPFDLAFVDLRLGTEQGIDLIPKLLAESAWLQVVVITAFATVETAVEAMRRGASDYLPKPFTPSQVRLAVERVSKLRALQQRVAGLEGAAGDSAVEIRSDNSAMRRAIELAHQVAATEA